MFFETCTDCGRDFHQTAAWQTRCYRCYRIYKEQFRSRKRPEAEWGDPFSGGFLPPPTQITAAPSRDAQWLRANIKELLHLCHPDKHGGSEQSNKITRELIKIFKER